LAPALLLMLLRLGGDLINVPGGELSSLDDGIVFCPAQLPQASLFAHNRLWPARSSSTWRQCLSACRRCRSVCALHSLCALFSSCSSSPSPWLPCRRGPPCQEAPCSPARTGRLPQGAAGSAVGGGRARRSEAEASQGRGRGVSCREGGDGGTLLSTPLATLRRSPLPFSVYASSVDANRRIQCHVCCTRYKLHGPAWPKSASILAYIDVAKHVNLC
jgi:hypothetical protein